jgi:hypothetical protein
LKNLIKGCKSTKLGQEWLKKSPHQEIHAGELIDSRFCYYKIWPPRCERL